MTKKDFTLFALRIAAERQGKTQYFVNDILDCLAGSGAGLDDVFCKDIDIQDEEILEIIKYAIKIKDECQVIAQDILYRKIDIIGRESVYYPGNLVRKLGKKAPPMFFAIGNLNLSGKRSVAVVGVRDALQVDVEYSQKLGLVCAENGLVVVSGGAVGVDVAAQKTVLNSGGESVAYVPQGFESSTFIKKNMKYINGGTLLCFSTCSPSRGFTVEAALNRNKYIHSHGDLSVTVHTKYKRGGSWRGAYDNIMSGRTVAAVSDIPYYGNQQLADLGAYILSYKELSAKGFDMNCKIDELQNR